MTNYSRTTLRELKKRYLNILKKCLLANLMMFAFSLTAHSGTATDTSSLIAELEKNERTVVESGTYTLTYDKSNALYDAESDSIIFPNIDISQSGLLSGGRLYNKGDITFNSDLKLVFTENKIESTSNGLNGGVIHNLGTMTFNSKVDFFDNKSSAWRRTNGLVIYNEGSIDLKKHVNFKNNIATTTASGGVYNLGSIYNSGGFVNFTSADFIGNQSGTEDSPIGASSAINNNKGGKITFTGVANFEDNKSFDNGGLQGTVISNKDTDSTITFLDKATFKNNEGYTLGSGQAFGGAIMNGFIGTTTPGAKIEFADVEFIENKIIGQKSGCAGAIYNRTANNNTITFNGTALFHGNVAEGQDLYAEGGAITNQSIIIFNSVKFINNLINAHGSYAVGSAILNSATGNIIFKEKATFIDNIAKGVTSVTGALDNRGTVTFENGFHFSGNETILVSTDENGNEVKTKKYEDIYMWTDAVTNLTGTDPNAEEYIGGGIRSRTAEGLTSTINKSSVATLVFGEESDSTGFTGVFNQTAGKTVARSETFLGGTNNILGGELETHGSEILYTAVVGQNKDETTGEVLSSGTLTHLALGSEPVEIKGLSFKEEGTNLSMTFKSGTTERGKYQINEDMLNAKGNKLVFENSDVYVDGNKTLGTIEAKNSDIDIGTSEVTVDKITLKENAVLKMTVNSLDEHGKVNGVITGTDTSKIALQLGVETERGIYQLFDRDNEVKTVGNPLFNIQDLEDGSFEIGKKTSEELSSSLSVGKNEGKALSAMMMRSSPNKEFKVVQDEVLEALQSEDKGTVETAKEALTALSGRSTSLYQSQATAGFTQLYNVVSQMLMNTAAPVFGHNGGEEPARAKVYIKGLYDRTKSSMGEGFRARSKGAVLGVQSEVTEDLTLGVGYATSQTTAKEDLRRTEVDTNTGFISAHYQPNAWWVSGLATFSRGEYEEEKQILSSMGKASYDVDSWGAQVMTGYDIKLENAIITPEVGMRYLSVKQEGYTDTLGTTVSGTRSDYLTALVGVKGTWNMGAIRPSAGVTVGYDIISDDVSALNTLANGASYTVNGEALDRLSTTVTTGIEADLGERTTLKLEYSGTYRKEYQDHSGMLKFELRF